MTQPIPGRMQTQPVSIEKVELPTIATYYANSVDILMSVYDLVMTFGQMRSASPDKVVIDLHSRVIMSMPHVKVLAALLNEKLADYEARFGPIPSLPSEALPLSEPSPAGPQ